MPRLGVNVDHVATLRQARRADYPSPLEAALAAERAGADAITVHLREDRRHIQDADLFEIKRAIKVHLNQELAPTEGMIELALRVTPNEVCIVPERRQELTTEAGLDVVGLGARLAPMIKRLKLAGIGVSLFIDPESAQVEAAARVEADYVELHTGAYATRADADLAASGSQRGAFKMSAATEAELRKIQEAVTIARRLGLKPNAGHGLNYHNVRAVAQIASLRWLHVGHAIVARAVMVGMGRAVREMKALLSPLSRRR